MRGAGLEPRPYRYRIEHRDGNLTPLILRFARTMPSAAEMARFEAVRLSLRGGRGSVMLIDQIADPEEELETVDVRRTPADPGGGDNP